MVLNLSFRAFTNLCRHGLGLHQRRPSPSPSKTLLCVVCCLLDASPSIVSLPLVALRKIPDVHYLSWMLIHVEVDRVRPSRGHLKICDRSKEETLHNFESRPMSGWFDLRWILSGLDFQARRICIGWDGLTITSGGAEIS